MKLCNKCSLVKPCLKTLSGSCNGAQSLCVGLKKACSSSLEMRNRVTHKENIYWSHS